MKKIISKNLISVALTVFLFLIFSFPVLAQNGTYDFKKQSGLGIAGNVAGYDINTTTSLEKLISSIIFILLSFVGVIFFGLVIYGAFTWMTAQGNEEKVKKANEIVMGSLFGLIITLSAYVLSYFLISYFWQ